MGELLSLGASQVKLATSKLSSLEDKVEMFTMAGRSVGEGGREREGEGGEGEGGEGGRRRGRGRGEVLHESNENTDMYVHYIPNVLRLTLH